MSRTLEFRVTGMHCGSCGMLIDDAVEELDGVTSSTTDARAERTVVELDDVSPIGDEDIIAAIEEAGYQAVRA